MLDALLWVAVGMIIGWNLLPQPAWIKRAYDNIKATWSNNA
jgi:hypothetical protein